MLTNVEVFAVGVTAPTFANDSDSAAGDLIQIHNIDGLGPVAAAINTEQYADVEGEFETGNTVGKRNIVISVGLNPDWADQTIESLRRILYQYFTPGQSVRLVFSSTHMPQVQISGYIESMDPNIFSKDPEIPISIICPKPYFVAVTSSSVTGSTVATGDTATTDVAYEGDAAVGFTLDVVQQEALTATGEFRLINNTPTTQLLSVTAIVDATHYLSLSTVKGDKYALQQLLPSGAPLDILGDVVPGSIWSPLNKGVNRLQIMAPTAGLGWTIRYNALYGGL